MKSLNFRCVVLEDEDDLRHWMLTKLKEYEEIEIVGYATEIDDAYRLIVSTQPDVAFMDVQLIGGDAFQLLLRLQTNHIPIPHIVIATGYPEYAMKALNDYRQYVVKYLTKPFVENYHHKFRQVIDGLMAAKLNQVLPLSTFQEAEVSEPNDTEHIFIQNRGSLLRIDFNEIAYIEAAGGGASLVVLNNKVHQVNLTLSKFMDLLPSYFYKISKYNIVNTKAVLSINRGERTLFVMTNSKEKELGISDLYYNRLIESLPLANKKVKSQIPVLKNNNTFSSEKQTKSLSSSYTKEQRKDSEKTMEHSVGVLCVSLLLSAKVAAIEKAKDIEKELRDCFEHFDLLLQKHQLKRYRANLYKDTYVTIAKEQYPHSPLPLIETAISISQFINERNAKCQQSATPLLQTKIGIHSAKINLAPPAQGKLSHHKIYEPLIDIAHSVKKIGSDNSINISAPTWKWIRRDFNCRYVNSIATTDLSDMEVYALQF